MQEKKITTLSRQVHGASTCSWSSIWPTQYTLNATKTMCLDKLFEYKFNVYCPRPSQPLSPLPHVTVTLFSSHPALSPTASPPAIGPYHHPSTNISSRNGRGPWCLHLHEANSGWARKFIQHSCISSSGEFGGKPMRLQCLVFFILPSQLMNGSFSRKKNSVIDSRVFWIEDMPWIPPWHTETNTLLFHPPLSSPCTPSILSSSPHVCFSTHVLQDVIFLVSFLTYAPLFSSGSSMICHVLQPGWPTDFHMIPTGFSFCFIVKKHLPAKWNWHVVLFMLCTHSIL